MPADPAAEASSPSNDSTVRDAVMKSKGLSMIDDLDAEEDTTLYRYEVVNMRDVPVREHHVTANFIF